MTKEAVSKCPVSRSQPCEWRTNKVAEPSSRGISNAQAAPAAVSAQDNWADTEFKSIMEMVVLIIEKSKDKEEALNDIKGLTILKSDDKNGDR